MIKNVKNIAVLVSVCIVITLLLSLTNYITAPIIEKNQAASANAALFEIMPDATNFESADISSYTLPATVTEVYKETSGAGFVVKLLTAGYGTDMVIMCGVTTDGVVTGAKCISSNETLGKEKTYGDGFAGKSSEGVEAVEIITGATKTTEAYKNAVKDALNTAIIMGGGSVDIRTEEEILADNLSAALPTGEGFAKMFIAESVDGVDAIYETENEAGYVCVIGEQFIGVDSNGKVVTEDASNADSKAATDAVATVKASTLKEIDLTKHADIESYIVSASVTKSGNYVIETKGAGYGIKGGNEYHPASGEYIVVKVAISADGVILDCLTVSEAETDGLGDACANEDFYGQFDGKTEANYEEIDAISGATLTTNGYKQAIERAYEAYHILKGGK